MSDIKVTQAEIDLLLNSADVQVRTEFGKCTVVTVRLRNGFILTESSACVDPANYDVELGKKLCFQHIENRLWELEGYALQKRTDVHGDVRQGKRRGLGTGGHRRDTVGAVQHGAQPRERKAGERYMVVLAPLSVWQLLRDFLLCLQQRQRRLRQRELCVWRGLRLLPLI